MAPLNGVYRGPCGIYAQSPTVVSPSSGQQGAGITAYATWLGKTVTYVLDYQTNTPTTWAQFTGCTLYNPRGAANYTALSTWGSLGARTMMLGLSPCAGRSTGSGGTTWAAEAAGTNDTYWTTLGNNLVSWGYGSAYLRIGREFNYGGYIWSPSTTGDTPNQYIAGYQHIVTLLKGIAGNSFKFMWNPGTPTGTMAGQAAASASYDTQAWYPGDSYVDSIGLDVYDWGNGSYPTQTAAPWGNRTLAQQQANWAYIQSGQDGLASWSQFASTHGKQLAFPEWGLQQWLEGSTYIGGGDDPLFVTSMANFMAANCLMQAMWEDPGQGVFDADSYAGGTLARTASLQAPDVSRTTFQFYVGNTNTGTGGTQNTGSGSTGGTPGQGIGSAQPPPLPVAGLGWEIFVRSYADYTTLLCQVPPSVYTTFQATKMLNDLGSGSVTLNMDAPWWENTAMGDGSTSNTILDFECLWQIALDGVVRFEFLGETITEQLVDPSEQRTVTVTGPGTVATLKWGAAMPQGFPSIILKLDGLVDTFGEISSTGSGVLDTNTWNVVSPAGSVYITPVPQTASQAPGVVTSASGTLTIAGTAGGTLLGSTPWDATDTLISAQISPVGAEGSATDASGSPVAYGTGLDGSELTQMYIESLTTTAYAAGLGLSATEFYAWFTDSAGTQVHVISSAVAYDLTNYAYWMITEQGGSGGGSGTFYWWTSPDGSTWTQQWTMVHSWDATYTGFFISSKYDTAGQSVILSSLNSNVTTPSYQGNIFLNQSSMGIWTSLLNTAQARGTIPFVSTTLSAAADSFGNAWTDVQNVQVTNGTDLYSLLQSFCATVNADYCMQPGFSLQVGQNIALGGTAVSLGADKSSQVIFREARDEMSKQRTRVRNQIANQIGLENSDGHEISANSATSIAEWGQREGWFQTSALVDPTSMEIAAAAFLAQGDGEILSWTLSIPPLIPGKTIFENFDVGDWVGLERPDWTAVDAVRVTGIAVQVDANGVETHELTLVSYLQWLQEQFTYVSSKLGGAFVNALGTTPVAPSKYGTGQVPTWFTPAATLANLADVIGTGGTGGSPLVYNSATGQWQSASAADPVSGAAVPLAIAGPAGTVQVTPAAVTVSAAPPAVAPDGGGAAPVVASTTHTPTATTIKDATGSTRVVIGQQSDGTITVVETNAPAPLAPDTPTVAGALSAIVVAWDGLLGSAAPLSDFQYVQVHVSLSSGFTPSSATLMGTMHTGGLFGVGNLIGGDTYYVKLVALNNSQVASTPSTQASAVALVPSAGSGAKVTIASTAPSSPTTGDLWYDTALGNVLEQWNGSAWTAYQYGAGAIATGAITATQIANSTITAAQISGSAAITGSQLAAAAGITGSQLSSSAGITGSQLANSTITLTQLGGAVTARALGGITTTISTTAPGSPTTNDLWINTTNGVIEQWSGSAWVVVTFNAANAIQAGTITASQILAGTITATQLAANSVTASQLAANSITAADMLANTITAGQIASGTITATQLAANSVTATQLAANSVTSAAILAGTIVASDIAANTITAAKLASGIVVAGIVNATTITGAQLIADGTQGQVLIYNGVPGAGNLVGSWSGAAGTDAYGNSYPSGISATTGTFSGSGMTGADITASTFDSGSVTSSSISNPAISGGTISETQITFDQVGGVLLVYSTTTTTVTLTSGTSWTASAGTYTQGKVECWGADASGSGGSTSYGGEAGGGGAYSCEPSYPLTPGNVYSTAIGAGGTGVYTGSAGNNGGQTAFDGGGVVGMGGQAGYGGTGGQGGAASGNTISHPGGNGGNGNLGNDSAGGGGRAGSTGAGGNGGNGGSSPGAAGAAGSGTGGHAGGAGVASATAGNAGGGGSGAGKGGSGTTYQTLFYDATSTASYYGTGYPSWSAGSLRNTNGSMFQGCSSGDIYVTGDQVSFANYNATQMGLDWTGWTIDQVTITINNQHSWYNTGCYCVLGYATISSNAYNEISFWTDEGATTANVDVTSVLGGQVGSFTALIFGPSYYTGSSTNLYNYGYFQGGVGAGSPRITITGHQGSGGSYKSGAGAGGVIKVTYVSATSLIAALAPAAGTDATSNAYAVGYTGAVQAIQPSSSPTVVEGWHTLTVGTVTNCTPSGVTARVKILAEHNMAVLDVQVNTITPTGDWTINFSNFPSAAYYPTQTRRPAASGAGTPSDATLCRAFIPASGAPQILGPNGVTSATITVMYPLD